jgi:putative ABC transport system substrate-binding protein
MQFDRWKRRDFVALLGSAAAPWPLAARAQQREQVRRIAMLISYAESDPEAQARISALRNRLQELGWTEGLNLRIEYRWGAFSAAPTERFARELIALQPDLILTTNTPTTASVQQQTHTIPIIFANVVDPLGSGFIASLSRPGGNITGFTNLEATIPGKWLELLKEFSPQINRVAFLFNPSTALYAEYFLRPFKTTAQSMRVKATVAPVDSVSAVESVIFTQASEPNGALMVMPDAFTTNHRTEITSLAARHRLPVIYPFRTFCEAGGLLSYGHDLIDQYRRVATYVDRVLKGAKPSALPVQAPIKFELVINLKSAKALGLTVPPTLLATADDVIE